MSQNCQSCHKQISGGEVCPFCFAPLVILDTQYTIEVKESEFSDNKSGTSSARKLPDLQAIQFRPSSVLYRSITKAKTGIASALVAVIFVGFGLFLWVGAQRTGAQEAAQQAQKAFDNQKYLASRVLWEQAFRNYKAIRDEDGQIESLLGMSECFQGLSQFTEAIVILQRVQKIRAGEDIAKRILQCKVLLGQAHLEQAEDFYQPDLYGKAFLEAKSAIGFFEEGEASDTQLASANRMAARCSMKLKDFEGAEAYLDQAFQLEGKTKDNLALASEVGKAYAQYRGRKLAGSGSDSYIPTGKIDPSLIAAANQKAASGAKKRRGTYGGYALNVYSPPPVHRNKRRVTVGTPSSHLKPILEDSPYPTHQKVSSESELTVSVDRLDRSPVTARRIPVMTMPSEFYQRPAGRNKIKPRSSRVELNRNYPTAGPRDRGAR